MSVSATQTYQSFCDVTTKGALNAFNVCERKKTTPLEQYAPALSGAVNFCHIGSDSGGGSHLGG